MIKQRRHFHSFNALRFVSFLLVFIHHIPVNETSFLSYFTKTGGVGVSFFFSLSGFLITYILLAEKLEQNKISLKHFFIKRILKIWPLFYAMLLFAYLTPFFLDYSNLPSSSDGYKPNWWYSVFFLENYQMLFTKDFPNTFTKQSYITSFKINGKETLNLPFVSDTTFVLEADEYQNKIAHYNNWLPI